MKIIKLTTIALGLYFLIGGVFYMDKDMILTGWIISAIGLNTHEQI